MRLFILCLLSLLLGATLHAQDANGFDLFGVLTKPYGNKCSLITLDTLADAKSLGDLRRQYPESWVAEYLEVIIRSECGGEVRKASGPNATLTSSQLRILGEAKPECNVQVEVHYIPENNLRDNPAQVMDFSLRMIPLYEAQYPGGRANMESYLRTNIIDQIASCTWDELDLATIRFWVSPEGEVVEPYWKAPSKDPALDELIQTAICSMPDWTPARDAAGKPIAQEFEFNLGTLLQTGCYRYR